MTKVNAIMETSIPWIFYLEDICNYHIFDICKTSNNYFNLKFKEMIKKDYKIRNYDSLLLGFPQIYLCEK